MYYPPNFFTQFILLEISRDINVISPLITVPVYLFCYLLFDILIIQGHCLLLLDVNTLLPIVNEVYLFLLFNPNLLHIKQYLQLLHLYLMSQMCRHTTNLQAARVPLWERGVGER